MVQQSFIQHKMKTHNLTNMFSKNLQSTDGIKNSLENKTHFTHEDCKLV